MSFGDYLYNLWIRGAVAFCIVFVLAAFTKGEPLDDSFLLGLFVIAFFMAGGFKSS